MYTNTFACQFSFKRLHNHSVSVSRASFTLDEDRAFTRQVTWLSGVTTAILACRLSFLADHAQNFPWVIIHVWSFTLRLKDWIILIFFIVIFQIKIQFIGRLNKSSNNNLILIHPITFDIASKWVLRYDCTVGNTCDKYFVVNFCKNKLFQLM